MRTGVICGTVTAVCGQLVRLRGVPSGRGTSYGLAHHFPPYRPLYCFRLSTAVRRTQCGSRVHSLGLSKFRCW